MDPSSGVKGPRAPFRFDHVRALIAGSAALALGVATYGTLRLGYADRLYHAGSASAVAEARRLEPANAAYFQNDPGDRLALERAVALDPRYSQGWIELGLLAEIEGDPRRAERCLLEANRVDGTYEPRWSLANFYFRHADQKGFWTWARRAAEMAYSDQTPLFQLCWRVSQDPAIILARAIPGRPAILAQYLYFLLLQKKIEEAEPVSERLISQSTAENLPLLLYYCDQLIGAGRMGSAVRCWNALCRRGLLPYRTLEPEQGRALTNGDFAMSPQDAGFDWRVQPAPGVNVVRMISPPALRISFSGSQPEHCELLAQVLPVEPGRAYRLAYFSRTSGVPAASGLRWYVADLASGKEISMAPLSSTEESWRQDALVFTAPAGIAGVRLVLEYRRAEGTTRMEAALWLRQISLSFQ